MMTGNFDIDKLVGFYLDGSIKEDDFETLKQWTSASEENKSYVRNIIEMYFSLMVQSDKTYYNKLAAFRRLEDHIQETKAQSPFKWKIFVSTIAATILFLLIPFTLYDQHRQHQMNDVTTLKVPDGSQLSCVLPDGTKITLNSGSELSYSRGFGIVNRDIRMKGEGYFDVVHKEDIPFTINSNYMKMTDLGTKFYFRDYSNETRIRVRLVDGKVSVHNNMIKTDDVFLNPGEILILDKATGKITTTIANKVAQQQDDLNLIEFDNLPLAQIAEILSRMYGVKLSIVPTSQNKRFYGSFNRKTDTFQDVLDNLVSTKRLHYKRLKGQYLLY
ncbi:MAG: FecR family protein [Prevotella sp.]|jgi:ferric-dicitrate binding protein FerR (iron transport regulator)|nr:FecR family protein [Prevotella sp.]MCI2080757.1 FecR family protein [Prevotella sp.]MCI2102668.1 FecR family protein [Prevotella sp.]